MYQPALPFCVSNALFAKDVPWNISVAVIARATPRTARRIAQLLSSITRTLGRSWNAGSCPANISVGWLRHDLGDELNRSGWRQQPGPPLSRTAVQNSPLTRLR